MKIIFLPFDRLRKFGLLALVFCIVICLYLFVEPIPVAYSYLPRYFNRSLKNIEKCDPNPGDRCGQSKSFRETFLKFPWDAFEEAIVKNVTAETKSYSKLFIDELTYFLELEPLVHVNQECKPPSLPSAADINCTLYLNAFTGAKRIRPAKVAVLLQFGFDVDVLEIHMNELFDVVDKYFVIESTAAHYGKLKKPLMWEHVQRQERFKKFPVVHFIVDDAESTKATVKEFSMEQLQERGMWLKFLEWNSETKYFSDDDIIGK